MNAYSQIPFSGQSLLRREDPRLITGQGCYTDDIKRPGMVHAVVVRSQEAHARIESIDLSEARAAPGVIDVISFADIRETTGAIPVRLAQLPGKFQHYSQLPLASDTARYVGEPIAVVVAEDRYFAEDAAELVHVNYAPLRPYIDATEAAKDEVLLHPSLGSNVATDYRVSHGDPEAAFRTAPYRRKERFRCHRHSAVPLETRGIVAEWSEIEGSLRVWGATKVPFATRRMLAELMRLPESQIEMIAHDIGGAFGVRGEFYPEDFLIPFLSRRLKRPVKWIEDRREHLMATNHAREMECELEIAVSAEGEILALRGEVLVDIGAYVRPNGGVAPSRVAQTLPGPYRIRHFGCRVTAVVTNKTPAASYRGPGRYEANFFRERLIDMAATDLGIDPAEFRFKNLLGPADMPFGFGNLVPYMKKPVCYDTGDYAEPLKLALDRIDYAGLKARCAAPQDGRLHGVGVTCYVASNGGGPGELARIAVTASGKIEVSVGASGAGQGHETTIAQIAADQLGVPYDDVTVFSGGTGRLDNGYGTWHSRSLLMGGSAVKETADKLKDQILTLAAERLSLGKQVLTWREGGVFLRDGAAPVLTLRELAAEGLPATRVALQADGSFSSEDLTYTYGAQIAHVAVDPKTAQVEILRFLVVEDIGPMVNPLLVHGQTIGGTVQGMGSAMLDEIVYDERGQLLTGSFGDYLLPTSTDFPNIEAVTLENYPTQQNPLGLKGAAEGGVGGPGAALGNAVAAALRPLKVEIRDLPLSPNKIFRAIKGAQR